MSLRKILHWPDPALSTMCEPVGQGEDVTALVSDMFETMYDAPGRGLSAPQIGVLKRVFVMDCMWKEAAPKPFACINPEIVARGDKTVAGTEACLSLPGAHAKVRRSESITLRWFDAYWQVHECDLTGIEAICAQHETDHLDGRIYPDLLSGIRRKVFFKAYEATR